MDGPVSRSRHSLARSPVTPDSGRRYLPAAPWAEGRGESRPSPPAAAAMSSSTRNEAPPLSNANSEMPIYLFIFVY